MEPGSVIAGKYRIIAALGRGGMATVFEAEHTATGAHVAVKLIHTRHTEPEIVWRFAREARATAKIRSQHIVTVFDAGVDEALNCPYLVMEQLVGEDLSRLLKRTNGPLPVTTALRIAAQACLGLAKAHEAGVVHRDIKPANLFLAETETPGEFRVKLLDFGIAKVKMDALLDPNDPDAVLTRTGRMVGSPQYMSPEQAQALKSIDHRADLWSLGVVLYKCLCGRTPFSDVEGHAAVLLAICSDPPPPLFERAPWVDPLICAIVHRALSADVTRRFQSANEMLAAITPWIGESAPAFASLSHDSSPPPSAKPTPPLPADTPADATPPTYSHSRPPSLPSPQAGVPRGAPQAVETLGHTDAAATARALAEDLARERRTTNLVLMLATAALCVAAWFILKQHGSSAPSAATTAPPTPTVAGSASAGNAAPLLGAAGADAAATATAPAPLPSVIFITPPTFNGNTNHGTKRGQRNVTGAPRSTVSPASPGAHETNDEDDPASGTTLPPSPDKDWTKPMSTE